jgi:4-amino-4-deoxy-L-arabinose transferase-like glycosyltransferase
VRKTGYILGGLVLIVIGYLTLFHNLGGLPLYGWDEAKHACKAGEALLDRHYFVLHFKGEPTNISTKPPFVIWLQALSMSVFGFNEFALRLPAALSGLLMVASFLFFSKKWFSSFVPGFLGSLVLLTSLGYLFNHCARRGEIDAFLCLFVFLYFACFLTAIAGRKDRDTKLYIILGFVFLSLAALTKGVAAFFTTPVLLGVAIWKRRAGMLLRHETTWAGMFLFTVSVMGYFIWRELFDPGYLKLVIYNDILGRFNEDLTGFAFPWYYYFKELYTYNFTPWLVFVPLAFLLCMVQKSARLYAVGLLAGAILQHVVISLAHTKLSWYAVPALPMLALPLGMGLAFVLKAVTSMVSRPTLTAILIIFTVFFNPVRTTLEKVRKEKYDPEGPWQMRYPEFVRQNPYLSEFYVASDFEEQGMASILHFLYLRGRATRMPVYEAQYNSYTFRENEVVLTCHDEHLEYLQSRYEVELLKVQYSCRLIRILKVY